MPIRVSSGMKILTLLNSLGNYIHAHCATFHTFNINNFFLSYRSTSNTEANFNNNGPEKSAKSHKIDDDHDDDFFDNLPDVDVNEFSASKKCKNKNTPKSSIVDYLKTGTASSGKCKIFLLEKLILKIFQD